MTTVNANQVALGIESFGDDDAPLVLLAGGTTMLSWPGALCERPALGDRPRGGPFLVLAFMGPSASSSERGALMVLLAVLAPAAALGGIAVNARHEAQENRAVSAVIAETLVENTARGERVRIARELHDVVAHHISMVVVQAEGARLAVPGLPAAGAQRLSVIGDTARAALVEMRQLLGVLRESAQVDAADRHPQPGLDQATALIDEAREASGAATRLILRGAPVPLAPSSRKAAD